MQIEPTESLDDLTVDSVALDVETLKNIAFNKKLSYLGAKIAAEKWLNDGRLYLSTLAKVIGSSWNPKLEFWLAKSEDLDS